MSNVIGFEIESLNKAGRIAIKKNAKIPFILRTLWSVETLSEYPLRIRIKLRDRFFKKNQKDSTKKLVLKSADSIIYAINNEMIKSGCYNDKDYILEVIEDD
jgi:hypothetical protein